MLGDAVWRVLYPGVPEGMGQRPLVWWQLTNRLCDFFKAAGSQTLEIRRMGRRPEAGKWRLAATSVLLPGDAQTSEVGWQPHMLPVESLERRSPLKALNLGLPHKLHTCPLKWSRCRASVPFMLVHGHLGAAQGHGSIRPMYGLPLAPLPPLFSLSIGNMGFTTLAGMKRHPSLGGVKG